MPTHSRIADSYSAPKTRPPAARFVSSWLPALLWLALILCASADSFSASHTSRFIEPALRWLFPHFGPLRLIEIHGWIRKAAHVTEYGVLAILFWRALRSTISLGGSPGKGAANGPQKTGWRWLPALGALATAAL